MSGAFTHSERGGGRGRGQGGRGRGRGRGGSNNSRGGHHDAKAEERAQLRVVSRETLQLLPSILASTHSPPDGYLYQPPNPPSLDPKSCPQPTRTKIQVLESDTYDAAILVAQATSSGVDTKPVCVLNMASDKAPGGGWLGGARAQEEALCRRSTLSSTLHRSFYPTPSNGVIYSPTVTVFRKSLATGHGLMDLSHPETLPVVSVISMAALRRPEVADSGSGRKIYANPNDRQRMKLKMRTILRLAAWKGHRRLVLGALGCGAFGNPREEVAECWAEVFGEAEFGGGWWESVVFAVIDETGEGKEGNGNVGVFYKRLDGVDV